MNSVCSGPRADYTPMHPSATGHACAFVGEAARPPSSRVADQTCAFTLPPALVSDDAPLACTRCNRLFRKLCSPELEDPLDDEPDAVDATAALPFTPFTRFWNVD